MLIIPLLIAFALYIAAFLVAARFLRQLRNSPRYGEIWAAILTITVVWLVVLTAISGGRILQLFAMTFARPNEDIWGMKLIGLIRVFIFAAPTPIAFAAVFVRPFGPWWRRPLVQVSFALGPSLLIILHVSFRGYCLVTVHDQFNNPVPAVAVTYFLDGRAVRTTDAEGHVHIPYYHRVHHLDIVDTKAVGYDIDYRRSSHRPYERIPAEVTLPAWKVLNAPRLLLMRPNVEITTDDRPYYINLLRQEASTTSLRTTDLEIRVAGPQTPPEPQAGSFRPDPFPWSVEIHCLRGGIQEAPEGYRYLAPAEGYQDYYRHAFAESAAGWNASFQKTFYLKLRDGKAFAVAEITVTSLLDKKRIIFIDAKINPAADRNLFWGYGNMLQQSQRETVPWLATLFGNEY